MRAPFNVHDDVDPEGGAGTVEGLLGAHNDDPTNEFVMPDGTILQQPLSFTDLYTTWANAWRVTQANSLLDYGIGQTTGLSLIKLSDRCTAAEPVPTRTRCTGAIPGSGGRDHQPGIAAGCRSKTIC